jgi:hypothetical protein
VTWQLATSLISHVVHHHASPKGNVWNASHVRNGVCVDPSWPAPHSLSSSSPQIFSTTNFSHASLDHISLPCPTPLFLPPPTQLSQVPSPTFSPPPKQLFQLPSPVGFRSSHCRVISPTRPAFPARPASSLASPLLRCTPTPGYLLRRAPPCPVCIYTNLLLSINIYITSKNTHAICVVISIFFFLFYVLN